MLDWLRATDDNEDDERGANSCTQILDAPETPAPLFAYRALRSVLFGSRYHDDDDEDDHNGINGTHHNKENIPLVERGPELKGKEMRVDADKGSINSGTIAALPASCVTPPRPTPRRMLSSPAKSILRTPGVQTPRRQNVAVQFKDAKISAAMKGGSASPGRRGKEGQRGEQHNNTMQRDENVLAEKADGRSKGSTVAKLPSDPASPQRHQSAFCSTPEMDAYIAATEREMKKLVRYGQRIREYARLSQKENAALVREVDKLKRDNEALRRGQAAAAPSLPNHNAGRRAGSGNDTNGDLFDLSAPSSSSSNLPTRPSTTNASAHEAGKQQQRQRQHENHQIHPSSSTTDEKPKMATSRSKQSPAKVVFKDPQIRPDPPSHNTENKNKTTNTDTDTSNARTKAPASSSKPTPQPQPKLAPDRRAATLARLRAKKDHKKMAVLDDGPTSEKDAVQGEKKTTAEEEEEEEGKQQARVERDDGHRADNGVGESSVIDWCGV